MQTVTELAMQRADAGFFAREQAALWIESRGPRLDALLKRAVASGEVWRLNRGLFCLSDRFTHSRVHPFQVAQLIHGPSYISMESALSYHGWIPEAVQAVTCATMGRSRVFESPLGVYTFTRVPQRKFYAGVRSVAGEGGLSFFLATPLKALTDLVYAQRHDWTSAEPVVHGLRVDEERLAELTADQFDEVMEAYRPGRVIRFLAGLRRELHV